MIRFVGPLLTITLLLGGCALVDDVRREVGPDPRPTASRPPVPPPPTGRPGGGPGGGRSGGPSGGPRGESDGGPGGCPPSGLRAETGEVNAAMGLRVMSVYLVNCGTVAYPANGYPEVRVLDGNRAPLPVTVGHGAAGVATLDTFDRPPAPVTAAPGERLSFGVVWRNTVNDTTIDPVNGVYLEVTPAVGQPPLIVRPEGRIDVGTTRRIGITAWRG